MDLPCVFFGEVVGVGGEKRGGGRLGRWREGAYSRNGEIRQKKGAEGESKRVRGERKGGVSKK